MTRMELKLARVRATKSQATVAKYLKVSPQRYAKIENGTGSPTLIQIKLLIELLKVNLDDF